MSADITRLLREAAANEAAASRHEDRYTTQMKAAGANVYHAFVLACKAAPEHKGRKIDDKAIRRIYESPARRPWWDAALASAKVAGKPATRDWGKRLIQWHLDPDAAQARRAQHTISTLAGRKKLEKQRTAAARGSTLTPEAQERGIERHAVKLSLVTEQTGSVAIGPAIPLPAESGGAYTLEDLLGEVNRISSAARKVKDAQRAAALETLRVTARELEELAG